jgi:hypothetical protein
MSKNYLLFVNIYSNLTNLNLWSSPYINYDIIVNYCGDNSDNLIQLQNKAKIITNEKNEFIYNILNNLCKNNTINLDQYKYIAVLDENIELERYDISICFELMNNYNLYFGSPATISDNKNILSINKTSKLRYTNIVDINKCFINVNILKEFFSNYSNELEMYGFEYLLLNNYKTMKDKISIFDIISSKEIKNNFSEEDINKFNELEKDNKVSKYEFCEFGIIEKNNKIFDINAKDKKIIVQKKEASDKNITQNVPSKNIIIKKNATKPNLLGLQIVKKNTTKQTFIRLSTNKSNTTKSTTIKNIKNIINLNSVKKNTTRSTTIKNIINLNSVKKNTTKSTTSKSLNIIKSNTLKKSTTKKSTNKVEKLIYKPKSYIIIKVK